MALTKTQVSELYVAIFNRASEGNGNAYWQGEEGSVADIANEMLDSLDAKAYFGSSLDEDQAFIQHIYLNTLGKTYEDDAEGIDYWVNELATKSRGEVIADIVYAAQLPENAGAAQDRFLNRVEVSNYTADNLAVEPENYGEVLGFGNNLTVTEDDSTVAAAKQIVDALADGGTDPVDPEEPVDPGVDGEAIFLTPDGDRVNGTADNDTFYAPIGTVNFTNGNTLNSGDVLNGGAGNDTVIAELINDGFFQSGLGAVRPKTESVENFIINAIRTSGSLEALKFGDDVTLNAANMYDVVNVWSQDSNADLVIQDITTKTSNGGVRNTEALTFRMDHTSNYNSIGDASDLTVYFDENYLLSGQDSEGKALFWLLDQDSDMIGGPALDNINVDGLRFSIDGGPTVVLKSPEALASDTHAEFVAALQSELNALIADGSVPAGTTLTLDASQSRTTYLDNGSLSSDIPAIVLTTGDGSMVTPIGYNFVEDEPGEFNLWARHDNTYGVEDLPITTNLELHKVGRGDAGGEVYIGGKAGGSIEVFNIDVLGSEIKPSNVHSINTGLNQGGMNVVNIATHADYVGGDTHASLTIRHDFNYDDSGYGPSRVDANAFLGDLTLGGIDEGYSRFYDIETFTATGGGDVAYYAQVGSVYGGLPSLGNLNYSATTGAGSDTVNVNVYGGAQMAVNTGAGGNDTIIANVFGTTTSGSTQSAITVTAMGGNNIVQLSSSDTSSATVMTGAGVDTVTGGGTNLLAITGAGNDVIYAENTGVKASFSLAASAATGLGSSTTVGHKAPTKVDMVELLNNRTVHVTLAQPNAAAAEGFVDGHELQVTVKASNANGITTAADLYRAIADGINSDPVTSKIATAHVDSNGTLQVQYLVDGATAASDKLLEIAVLGDWVGSSTTTLLSALKVAKGDSGITSGQLETLFNTNAFEGGTGNALDGSGTKLFAVQNGLLGTDSSTAGENRIIAGEGDDVVVLSSNAGTTDEVVMYAGNFGSDTIVHFTAGAVTAGADVLVFGWLDNKFHPGTSSSAESAEFVDVALNTGLTSIAANSVSVVDYTSIVGATNFAQVNGSTVLAELNSSGTIATTTGLVGSVNKSILMVENVENKGEYKVFQVESNDTTFTSATLVGTLDFGQNQAFDSVNFDGAELLVG